MKYVDLDYNGELSMSEIVASAKGQSEDAPQKSAEKEGK